MWQKILAFLKSVWKWIRTDGLLHISIAALIVCAFGWIRPVWIPATAHFRAGTTYSISIANLVRKLNALSNE